MSSLNSSSQVFHKQLNISILQYKLSEGWTLTGIPSKSQQHTGFYIPEINLALDAADPTIGLNFHSHGRESVNPNIILVTHNHVDHVGQLHLLLRNFVPTKKS